MRRIHGDRRLPLADARKNRWGTMRCKFVLGSGHRHIEQTTLLFDLRCRASAKIGWEAAVDDIEHEHRFPLLTLRGMNGREDQIILIA